VRGTHASQLAHVADHGSFFLATLNLRPGKKTIMQIHDIFGRMLEPREHQFQAALKALKSD
jgi:hypothetical protein